MNISFVENLVNLWIFWERISEILQRNCNWGSWNTFRQCYLTLDWLAFAKQPIPEWQLLFYCFTSVTLESFLRMSDLFKYLDQLCYKKTTTMESLAEFQAKTWLYTKDKSKDPFYVHLDHT